MNRILNWLDWLTQRFKDQPAKDDRDTLILSQMSPFTVHAPAPPIHDAILASRRQAILFRQIVPPNHDPAHLSFFGGMPIVPSGFQWPRGESMPYSFIMQVDCSAVPTAGRLGIFPDDGVLYLFLDLLSGYEDRFRVIWESGPTQGWAEIAPPDDLPHAFDSKVAWRWPQSDADWPRLLPKWPFDPVLIRGGPSPDEPLPDDEEGFDETYAWPGTIDPKHSIPAIEGAVVKHRSWYDLAKNDRPFAGFPHDWNAVRITTGLIAEGMKSRVADARNIYFRELSEHEYASRVAEAQAELRDWSDRASAAVAFAEVPPVEREQFRLWIQKYDWLTGLPMIYAGDLSVEASLTASPEAAARIPHDVVDYIRGRHALAVEMESGLHLKVWNRMLAPPTAVQDNLDRYVREFLLLLELGSDDGLAHYFGEGVYQFWIRPGDLAARRFDRVVLGTTAY